jgi:hypothetical protein
MINRIRTRLHELREQAQLRHMLRHIPPTVRADLLAAAERTLGQQPATGANPASQDPVTGFRGASSRQVSRHFRPGTPKQSR